ncbi:MAG TPA: hypothetical protein VM165_02015 [Planctomycetaceae bacterium]|nr:hypothetical protein [Planctomycetaceae bacterium]
MIRSSWLMVVTVAAVVTSLGCRQVQTRSSSPTPLPAYESAPAFDTSPMPPRLSPVPPPPSDATGIPAIPPSTVMIPKLDGAFGFTAPKLPETDWSPQLPPLPETPALDHIQPAGSEDDVAAAAEVDVEVPLFAPMPERKGTVGVVELDPSLFLLELFEEALIEVPSANAVPTTVNGLTIQPWKNPELPSQTINREPPAWPADGVTPTLTITPGPVFPKWTPDPLPTRPPNSQPRRLRVGNSDSEIRPIE